MNEIAELNDAEPVLEPAAAPDRVPTDGQSIVAHRAITAPATVDRAARTIDRCRKAYDEYEFHSVYHRVLDLCTVDVSAVYVDVTKDTMYCDAPGSKERRSAQTAMYHVLRALTGVIAPILSFTADEIYEATPGSTEKSVHLTTFPEMKPLLTAEEEAQWLTLLRLREAVNMVLERARAAMEIGKSLEADVVLYGNFDAKGIDLAKLFIVSNVDILTSDESVTDGVELEGIGRIGIAWAPARGKKCGRCWIYRAEVASDGDLCNRCQGVIDTLAPREVPTA